MADSSQIETPVTEEERYPRAVIPKGVTVASREKSVDISCNKLEAHWIDILGHHIGICHAAVNKGGNIMLPLTGMGSPGTTSVTRAMRVDVFRENSLDHVKIKDGVAEVPFDCIYYIAFAGKTSWVMNVDYNSKGITYGRSQHLFVNFDLKSRKPVPFLPEWKEFHKVRLEELKGKPNTWALPKLPKNREVIWSSDVPTTDKFIDAQEHINYKINILQAFICLNNLRMTGEGRPWHKHVMKEVRAFTMLLESEGFIGDIARYDVFINSEGFDGNVFVQATAGPTRLGAVVLEFPMD